MVRCCEPAESIPLRVELRALQSPESDGVLGFGADQGVA